jgi:hypothetical protein
MVPNYRHDVTVQPGQNTGEASFSFVFAFRLNIGSTFFVYARDHTCPPDGFQSNVVELNGVANNDTRNVGTLTIDERG